MDLDALGMSEDAISNFSVDELREFLEADLIDVPIDPEFKERLREQLWNLVQRRSRPVPAREPN